MDRRRFMVGSAGAAAVAALSGAAVPAEAAIASGQTSNPGHVRGVTAITQVFGTGQKLTAVAVEYDRDIDGSKLSKTTYKVAGRTVTGVYTNREAGLDPASPRGRYVIIELSPDDAAAALWVTQQGSGSGSGSGGAPPGPGGPTVGDSTPGGTVKAATASLVQQGTVYTAHGAEYPAVGTTLTTSRVVNLIVDDFRQFSYDDPATGRTLKYNLFAPRHLDHHRSYPLVLFMHDASVVNVATVGPLVQGLGAVCWASPSDQAGHEAFVLAPEYPAVVIDDNYKPSTYFDATVNLVKSLTNQFPIDTGRLYATGQSMGAMMALGMNIKHPGLFAASFIVAGQWPASQATPLAKTNLWVLVSKGDTKAYPGENEIMSVVEKAGAKVTTATWNGESSQAEFAADVASMEAHGTAINYAAFTAGTLGSGSEHMGTWHVAYSIPGIRDWIMSQSL
jgi:predicted peptidase